MGTGRSVRRWLIGGMAAALVLTVSACGVVMAMMHGGPERPPESEFGLGSCVSASGLYRVTLAPVEPLAKRKLQQVQVVVQDAAGQPVEGASLEVDGGMPQHGHGLPTRPRMTKRLGEGRYQVDGVRFNMGGWWELKFAVSAAAGTDSVTFNLSL